MEAAQDRLGGAWKTPGVMERVPSVKSIETAAESFIEERPVATTLVVFGLGVGLGTAIGMMLSDCFVDRSKATKVESLTQNVMDGLSRMVPDVISRHFHS